MSNQMKPQVWITQLEFSGGTTIKCNSNDVIVIVGPNNVGKSASLRGIENKLVSNRVHNPIIKSIEFSTSGSLEDAIQFFQSIGKSKYPGTSPLKNHLNAFGQEYDLDELPKIWKHEANALGPFAKIFCRLLSAEERLSITKSAKNISITTSPLEHPTHFMVRDEELEISISNQIGRAFGIDLILNRAAGDTLPLHVGKRPNIPAGGDRLSPSYLTEVDNLPLLQEQGDGMRGFAGIILSLKTGQNSVLLLDEPEAFLHPPQAKYLGQILSHEAGKGKQIFIATHSGDILRGLLESKNSKVRIIRLERKDNLNYAHELAPEDITDLWSDSLLR